VRIWKVSVNINVENCRGIHQKNIQRGRSIMYFMLDGRSFVCSWLALIAISVLILTEICTTLRFMKPRFRIVIFSGVTMPQTLCSLLKPVTSVSQNFSGPVHNYAHS